MTELKIAGSVLGSCVVIAVGWYILWRANVNRKYRAMRQSVTYLAKKALWEKRHGNFAEYERLSSDARARYQNFWRTV